MDEWTRHRGALSGRAWRRSRSASRSPSSRSSSLYPARGDRRARPASERRRAARRPHRSADARGRLVHASGRRSRRPCSRSRSRCPPRTCSVATASAAASCVSALVVVPFVLPTVVVALAFLAILPDGVERGWAPILIAHVFFNVAVVVRIVGTFWASLDPRAERGGRDARRVAACAPPRGHAAAARAGARGGRRDRLPLLVHVVRRRPDPRRPAVRDARGRDLQPGRPALRPPSRGRPLARAARLRRGCRLGRDAARAAARRRHGQLRPSATRCARSGRRRDKLVVGVSLGGLALFLGLPLAVLVERSLAVGDGYGLDAYEALGAPDERPARGAVGGGRELDRLRGRGDADRRRRRWARRVRRRGLAAARLLDGLVLLPLGASAVMLGLGFLIAFDTPPLDFRAAPWLVPVAQALVAIPFVVRIVAPTLRSIDPHQREAAALLGASPGRVRREIDLPIVSRGARRRRRLRVRDLARRVRRDRVPRAARPADASRRDLSLPRAARGDERRAGVRARGRAHGRHRRRGAPRRTGARAPRRVVLMLRVERRDGRVRRRARRSTRRRSTSRTARSSPCSARAAPGRRRCCASSPGLQRARRGPRRCSTARPRRRAAAPARRRPHLPGPRALPAPRRRRQRRVRPAHARRLAGGGRVASGRAARARRPRRTRAPLGRARSRAASSSASRSRARSRRSRACSSSTSRSARSTAGCATGSSTTSSACSTSSRLTAVYVTHDQAEAFALGDRVAVMRDGRVVQVATPDELWAHPLDEDVARFLGLANVADDEVVRPEAVRVRPATGDGQGVVERVVRVGPVVRLRVRLDDGRDARSGRRGHRRIRAPATGSTSRSTRRASSASDDPPPRRRPRARPGRVLSRLGASSRRRAPA